MSLYVGDCIVCTCTPDGHLHTVTYTRCLINTIDSPDDGQRGARNMWRTGINIYKKELLIIYNNCTEMRSQQNMKFKNVCVFLSVQWDWYA
jgi:hypothetical protein